MDATAFSQKLSAFTRWLRSRRAVSVYKGTYVSPPKRARSNRPTAGAIAYTIGFILIFLRPFGDLSAYPLTFTSMTIMLIIGGAGKSFGSCIQSTSLALVDCHSR